MLKSLYLFTALLILTGVISCQQEPATPLQIVEELNAVDSFKTINGDTAFQVTYELWFQQPVDHNNPDLGTFPQKVIYSHKGFDKPVVVVLEGYALYGTGQSELCRLLDANQITIEHRFFDKSRPKDSIPWSNLTVANAAADQHNVIQAFKPWYSKKWISTGISKGGQTTIFHRSLYPKDVDVSVPYVAPLNFSATDERVQLFLDTVGTAPCRQKIHDFQVELLERKDALMPFFEEEAKKNDWEFKMGLDSAYDLAVFEFSFALWQWVPNDCESIPPLDANNKEIFHYWKTYTGFSFFEQNSIAPTLPFFFQGMTEIGMYGYDADEFKGYTDMEGMVDFSWTLPKGYENAEFNPKVMRKVDRWVKNEGDNMLYLYGGQDAWSATAAEPGAETNAVRLFNPEKNHSTRIRNYPEHLKDSIYSILEKWTGVEVNVGE
ncbi:Prolyl tri/tetrapeptidyl aminopeptidase precursor [Salinivirga cyanobacteriivorans]|uniref:Prolyl tri/tetrapeptidyl aminopeptidase n=1 Tax=Salinivirga cyanobacteriivorans TaxID=1307839 RepID=A0A0S2HX24_9BACT|nr:S28 family serine protease [Salinivirga cyanobacteriivorans]ALO14516.1 Prolyl tri/tetrapeptidyl aminopeptidase precursor [Salinivirga cyanobacteriivorans]